MCGAVTTLAEGGVLYLVLVSAAVLVAVRVAILLAVLVALIPADPERRADARKVLQLLLTTRPRFRNPRR
jgi:hypothetical protein